MKDTTVALPAKNISMLLLAISRLERRTAWFTKANVLRNIIRFYGDTMQSVMSSYLELSLAFFNEQQHQFIDQFVDVGQLFDQHLDQFGYDQWNNERYRCSGTADDGSLRYGRCGHSRPPQVSDQARQLTLRPAAVSAALLHAPFALTIPLRHHMLASRQNRQGGMPRCRIGHALAVHIVP